MRTRRYKSGHATVAPALGTLFNQLSGLNELASQQHQRVVEYRKRIEQTRALRQRITGLCDALLRQSHAEDLMELGAEDIDTHCLSFDTPFDGTLITLTLRHLPSCKRITQFVSDENVPSPIFAADFLGCVLERLQVDKRAQPKDILSEIVIVDGRMLSAADGFEPANPRASLAIIFPLAPGAVVSEVAETLTGAGFGTVYTSPAGDYLVGWRV